jgi:hypothetical protein
MRSTGSGSILSEFLDSQRLYNRNLRSGCSILALVSFFIFISTKGHVQSVLCVVSFLLLILMVVIDVVTFFFKPNCNTRISSSLSYFDFINNRNEILKDPKFMHRQPQGKILTNNLLTIIPTNFGNSISCTLASINTNIR